MRGYGRSSVYRRHEDYALRESTEALELLDSAGPRGPRCSSATTGAARWSGAWPASIPTAASASPTSACPTSRRGFAPANIIPLVDRTVYPEAKFPAGQWEYMFFYEENFAKAQMAFEANVANTVKAIFRAGSSSGKGKPARTALVRRDGGWFGGLGQAPDVSVDRNLLSEEDLHSYIGALSATASSVQIPGTCNPRAQRRIREPGKEWRQAGSCPSCF